MFNFDPNEIYEKIPGISLQEAVEGVEGAMQPLLTEADGAKLGWKERLANFIKIIKTKIAGFFNAISLRFTKTFNEKTKQILAKTPAIMNFNNKEARAEISEHLLTPELDISIKLLDTKMMMQIEDWFKKGETYLSFRDVATLEMDMITLFLRGYSKHGASVDQIYHHVFGVRKTTQLVSIDKRKLIAQFKATDAEKGEYSSTRDALNKVMDHYKTKYENDTEIGDVVITMMSKSVSASLKAMSVFSNVHAKRFHEMYRILSAMAGE